MDVADNGIGISPKDQEIIFEKFRQVGDTFTDKPQGTGLGLPICREIIGHCGGRLWVESEPQPRRDLLLRAAVAGGAVEGDRHTIHGTRLREKPNEERMAKKILIADDEPNIVISLEFLMQRNGYEVKTAGDGEAALRLASEFRPDLILLDIMLPLKSGYEVCQKIRENPEVSAMKVVMITAKGRDIEVAKGLALGADAYITKPFSTQDLLEQVKRLLSEAA